jgi:hypothetical protein
MCGLVQRPSSAPSGYGLEMPHDPVRARDPRHGALSLDLETLPPEVRFAVEAMVAGSEVTLRREGHDLGVLTFRASLLEGTVISGAPAVAAHSASAEPEPIPDGVTVVATATRLSDAARRRLSDELGSDYIVLDLLKAPPTADVVLIHPVSPQLVGSLRSDFPNARIIVTEIDDEELEVSQPGPVSRLLDAGVSAYLPPRPLREVASSLHAYLTGSGAPQLTAGSAREAGTAALPTAPRHRSE